MRLTTVRTSCEIYPPVYPALDDRFIHQAHINLDVRIWPVFPTVFLTSHPLLHSRSLPLGMAPLLNPPFRADHIGSLKRPAALLQKRAEFDAQKISQEELTKTEDEAINDIVKMQNEVGIKAVTDGEFRRVRSSSPAPALGSLSRPAL